MSKLHWLAIATLPGIGGATARKLVERFGSIEAAFAAPDEELLRVPRFTAEVVARLRAVSLEALETELTSLHPDTPARGSNLMARDRIISGLSRTVIVVEAGEKSGSLDTAARARRQGRLLLAVPGSPGTQALLAGGAEPLDPQAGDLNRLSQRIRAYSPNAGERQLSLWSET